jgi:hypothetical protein
MNQAWFNPIQFSVLVPSWNLYFHQFLIFVFSLGVVLGTPVSSINKTDCHNVTEILLKVALNTKSPSSKLHNTKRKNKNQKLMEI